MTITRRMSHSSENARKESVRKEHAQRAEGAQSAQNKKSTACDTTFAAEIPADATSEGAGRATRTADRADAIGGVQRRHRAGRAVAYRGIRAEAAQVAGRQSFGDAVDAGISGSGRRTGRSRGAADTAEIAGRARIAQKLASPLAFHLAFHRKHGIVDLLAIGERAVGQRMFGDDL